MFLWSVEDVVVAPVTLTTIRRLDLNGQRVILTNFTPLRIDDVFALQESSDFLAQDFFWRNGLSLPEAPLDGPWGDLMGVYWAAVAIGVGGLVPFYQVLHLACLFALTPDLAASHTFLPP